jgi:tetratricopeptide (TPR) repeat protein
MKKYLLTVLLLHLAAPWVWACLDMELEDETLVIPVFESQSVNPGDAYFERGDEFYAEDVKKWQQAAEESGKWRDKMRYAVALAFVEDYQKALKILLDIEAAQPGEYTIAINLATVYEQLGQYRKALTWMDKAIAIDPNGNFGSEWIHRNILQVKVNGRAATCTTYELIQADFGTDAKPQTELDTKELDRLKAMVFLQIDQRVYLDINEDPCSALLLFELGNMNFLRGFPTASLRNYAFAEELGMENPLLDLRVANVTTANYAQPQPTYAEDVYREQLRTQEEAAATPPKKERQRRNLLYALGIIGSVILLVGLVIVVGVLSRKSKYTAKIQEESTFDELFGGNQ